MTSRTSFALLVTAALLVGCGTSRPGGTTGTSAPQASGDVAGTRLEAEGGAVVQSSGLVTPQAVVKPGQNINARVINDSAASGGQAVALLGNDNAVRFTVPSSLGKGRYTVRVRARADRYNGNPRVALRINGEQKSRADVGSDGYETVTLGVFDLAPGYSLDVVFVNDEYDGNGRDRNVFVDDLILDPAGASSPVSNSSDDVDVPGNAVNVKTFGARGDGSSDDTEALREAAESGKSLYFPAGNYRVRRVISFNGLNGQTITGQNAALVQDRNFMRDGDNAVLFIKNSHNVTVQGVSVKGNRTDSTSPGVDIEGVRVANSSNVTLRSFSVSRADTCGISVWDSTNTVIENVTVNEATRHGIWIYRSRNTRLSGNTINGNGKPNNNELGGIGILATNGNGFTAENNVIRNMSDDGTKTEAVDNVVYRGNTVDVFGRDGIKVMPHHPSGVHTVHNVLIEGNTISGFRAWAEGTSSHILVHSTFGARVIGNTVNGSGFTNQDEDGVRVNAYFNDPRSNGVEVRDNTLRNVETGLLLAADNIQATGNRIEATRHAVILQGVDLTLKNNPELRGGTNITVLYNRGAQGDVIGNSFYGHDTGVWAGDGSNRGRVADNTFASSYSKPVVVKGSNVSYEP